MAKLLILTSLSTLLMIAFANIGSATCYNNEEMVEPLRKFNVCVGDDCIEDILLYECGGASWNGAAFESGYSVDCSAKVEGDGYNTTSNPSGCKYFLRSVQLTKPQIDLYTCTPINLLDSGCMWYE